jgi:predicted RNase H-like HicB family nuclease
MTKKMVDTTFCDVKYSLDGSTLEEALHKIKQWIQLYGGRAKFDIGQECESYSNSDMEYAYVNIVGKREETDEEYAKRTTQKAEHEARADARDKVEFERLQKKFGSTK